MLLTSWRPLYDSLYIITTLRVLIALNYFSSIFIHSKSPVEPDCEGLPFFIYCRIGRSLFTRGSTFLVLTIVVPSSHSQMHTIFLKCIHISFCIFVEIIMHLNFLLIKKICTGFTRSATVRCSGHFMKFQLIPDLRTN